MRRTLLSIFAAGLAALPAVADTVCLKDGRVLTGRVEQIGETIRLHMEYGTLEFSLDEIRDIEYEPRYEEEYRRRLHELDESEPDELFELSQWCAKHDLSAQRDQLLHKVLALDPEHEAAREALGYVRVGAMWTTVASAMRSAEALFKLRRYARTDRLCDRVLKVASDKPDLVAALNLKAAVCLKLGRNGDALRAYRRAAQEAEDQRLKLIIEAKRDILAAHPDGLFLVTPQLPTTRPHEPPKPLGLQPLADERVMQIALRESAKQVVASGRRLLTEARRKEPLQPAVAAGEYQKAEEHFQAADALAPGIAVSYRVETLRRRIHLIRRSTQTAYDRINADWAVIEAARKEGQPLSRTERSSRYARILKNLNVCQRAEQKILRLASGFPDELAAQIEVTQENLTRLSSLREVIQAEPS
jgi:tetratricopeptide (TPR) repeat protein